MNFLKASHEEAALALSLPWPLQNCDMVGGWRSTPLTSRHPGLRGAVPRGLEFMVCSRCQQTPRHTAGATSTSCSPCVLSPGHMLLVLLLRWGFLPEAPLDEVPQLCSPGPPLPPWLLCSNLMSAPAGRRCSIPQRPAWRRHTAGVRRRAAEGCQVSARRDLESCLRLGEWVPGSSEWDGAPCWSLPREEGERCRRDPATWQRLRASVEIAKLSLTCLARGQDYRDDSQDTGPVLRPQPGWPALHLSLTVGWRVAEDRRQSSAVGHVASGLTLLTSW